MAANPKPLRQRCGVAGIGLIQKRLNSRFILRRDTVCGPPTLLVAKLARAKGLLRWRERSGAKLLAIMKRDGDVGG